MADVGLNCFGVEVYYNFFPPNFMVTCELTEFLEQRNELSGVMAELSDTLHSVTECLNSASAVLDAPPESESYNDMGSSAEPFRIQLQLEDTVEQTDTNSNAPPVHLWIHVPLAGRKLKEHFVIDDFWDFVQIKFDDSVFDSEYPQLDVVDISRYDQVHRYEGFSPEVRELLEQQRSSEAERILTRKILDKEMRDIEGTVMSSVK